MATSRSKARRRAVEVLYEAETIGEVTPAALRDLLAARQVVTAAQSPLPDYAGKIVSGIADHLGEIDDVLATYQTGRSVARLPQVDRAVLRLGVWEILFSDTPDAVAVDEAVTLVALLSTDDSPKIVNGLLGRIKELAPTLREFS